MKKSLLISTILAIFILSCAASASDSNGPPEPNGPEKRLVAHWKFDEPNGSLTAIDSAGVCNGLLKNGASRADGKFGSALKLDGVNDYVEVNSINDSAIEFSKNNRFTISVWAKPSAIPSNGGYLLTKMRASAQFGVFGYELGYNLTSKLFSLFLESSRQANVDTFTEQNSAPPEQWHHFVTVYDNTQIRLYVNGTLRTTNTFNLNTGATVPDKGMAIGARSYDSVVTGFYGGLLDDIRIYNGALDADEIAALYEEGTPPMLQRIEIQGPNSVPEESDTKYRVMARFDDGSSKNVTSEANLSAAPDEFAFIKDNGILATERLYRLKEACTISADYEGLAASKNVVIYPVCDGNNCTERQIFERNIEDTIAIKQGLLEELNYAIKIERATVQMSPRLMLKLKPAERNKIAKINIKILAAITDELWAKKGLNSSINSLEDALKILNPAR